MSCEISLSQDFHLCTAIEFTTFWTKKESSSQFLQHGIVFMPTFGNISCPIRWNKKRRLFHSSLLKANQKFPHKTNIALFFFHIFMLRVARLALVTVKWIGRKTLMILNHHCRLRSNPGPFWLLFLSTVGIHGKKTKYYSQLLRNNNRLIIPYDWRWNEIFRSRLNFGNGAKVARLLYLKALR